MARSRSRLTAEIDFDRDGKENGFIRLPYSVHRSAYGWIPIPVVCIKNGDGPRVLLMGGNHGDEYEGQVALGKLIRSLEAEKVHGRIIILPRRPMQMADKIIMRPVEALIPYALYARTGRPSTSRSAARARR
jgi:predicted deacylase